MLFHIKIEGKKRDQRGKRLRGTEGLGVKKEKAVIEVFVEEKRGCERRRRRQRGKSEKMAEERKPLIREIARRAALKEHERRSTR